MAELEAVLLACTSPDTAKIAMAEAYLKDYCKKPACVGGLLLQLQQSTHVSVRQLAPVLLRSRVMRFWSRLDAHAQGSIKHTVLGVLASETDRLVRRATALVVAAVAKHLMPTNQWPELLTFMSAATSHETPEAREVGLLLFYTLTPTIGKHLRAHLDSIKAVYARGLTDPASAAVRTMALKAAGEMFEFLSEEADIMRMVDLVPSLLTAIQGAVASGNDEVAVSALEVFSTLATSPRPVLDSFLADVVSFVLKIVAEASLDVAVRDAAVLVLTSIIKTKPRMLSKKKSTISDVIAVLMQASKARAGIGLTARALCCGGLF